MTTPLKGAGTRRSPQGGRREHGTTARAKPSKANNGVLARLPQALAIRRSYLDCGKLLLLTEPPERSRRGSAERSGDNEAGAARAFRRRRDALTDRKEEATNKTK